MPENPYELALNRKLFGLAISGGGIRSATFALGVLQHLAESGLLKRLDYLSTVSGGGYIGSWLQAWIQRANIDVVEKNIQQREHPLSEQSRPVRFLREYSQYLTPRPGVFSADLWTMVAVFIRNLILNQTIIFLVLAALLTVPLTMIGPLELSREHPGFALSSVVAAKLMLLSVCLMIRRAMVAHGTTARWKQTMVVRLIVIPTVAACVLLMIGMWGLSVYKVHSPVAVDTPLAHWFVTHFYLIAFCVLFVGLLAAHRTSGGARHAILQVGLIAVAALLGVGFCAIPKFFIELCRANTYQGDWEVLVVGPTLMLIALGLTVIFYVGLLGTDLSEGRREWWSRLGAWLALSSASWLLVAGIAIYGPIALYRLHPSIQITAGSLWAIITAVGTKFAASSKTGDSSGDTQPNRVRELIALIAPYVFVAGLLCLVSMAVAYLAHYVDDGWPMGLKQPPLTLQVLSAAAALVGIFQFSIRYEERVFNFVRNVLGAACLFAASLIWLPWAVMFVHSLVRLPHSYGHVFGHYWATLNLNPGVPLLLFTVFAAGGVLLSMRVDVNEFSMHHFYRNRLVRAYLGASRERKIRRPSPFTGFEERDDLALALLSYKHGFFGPLPILNAALNMTRGEDLATQERKAESFAFTPFRTGFDFFRPHLNPNRASLGQYGFQKTEWCAFGRPHGVWLGTAMAISGAAVSPNMGYHSKPAVAFLLSLFNIRLGWWMRNPALPSAQEETSPPFGLLYLLRELAGYTDVSSPYLNLSDGGHFENMALYELVRRKCRYIIVSDGEQDGAFSFNGIGAAIRKCRTDFGVEIELDPRQMQLKDGSSPSHWALGTIKYPENGADGYILYLKSTLTGDEPADVLQYKKQFPDFPHQSTGDQFFTESQFESYRCLGYHIASTIFKNIAVSSNLDWKEQLFEALRQKRGKEDATCASTGHSS